MFERRLRKMENEVYKSVVRPPLDAHFPEDAPQNGQVASKALKANFDLRSQVCNKTHS